LACSARYTKRGLLLPVYVATELYMLTDASLGRADTWASLDRRLHDANALGKGARDMAASAGVAAGPGSNMLLQFFAKFR
jgi:ubiquinone biosynthesis protein COQ9